LKKKTEYNRQYRLRKKLEKLTTLITFSWFSVLSRR
jgi:hypothetical protein